MIAFLLMTVLAITPVPDGKCILINGQLGEREWSGSATMPLDPTTELRFHQDGENLFLAIVFLGPRHTGIDLHLKSRDRHGLLHVSSALGERTYSDEEWSEFSWGRNAWWTANTIGSIVEEGRQRFLKPDAFEFQLDRRDLGPEISLFIHLKRPEKLLPQGASAATLDGWIQLKLD
ncbi:MAG: hypothetical protein GY835_13725 [bacterium]|nr:hypothetical protein [bacterium]